MSIIRYSVVLLVVAITASITIASVLSKAYATSPTLSPHSISKPPEQGDLAIYSLGYQASSPLAIGSTLLLLIDPSMYLAEDSKEQMSSLQQALIYIMDTPGALADNLQVGIAKMADSQSADNGSSKLLVLPVQRLGKVADSSHPNSQRYKIKNFITDHCPQWPNCRTASLNPDRGNLSSATVNSAMAYAEAAAYMMGTDTKPSSSSMNGIDYHNETNSLLVSNELVIAADDISDVLYTNATDATMPVAIESLAQILSENSNSSRFSKPLYNQCSAKQFTATQQSTPLDYAVGNAIIVISSESPSFLSSTNSGSSTFLAKAPLTMMARSLSVEKSSLAPAVTGSADIASLPPQCQSRNSSYLSENNQDDALYWYCLHQYAQHLNQFNSDTQRQLNPAGISLKTGVISFGRAANRVQFTGLNKGLPDYDCLTVLGITRQRCLLGQYGQYYGEGGFYQSVDLAPSEGVQSRALAKALLVMANNLIAKPAAIAVSAPMQLPHPLQPKQLLSASYLPFIQPRFGSQQAQWPGGVKKYEHSHNGFGNKSNKLIKTSPIAVEAIVAAEPVDLWSKRLLGVINTVSKNRNVYLSQSQSGALFKQSIESLSRLNLAGFTELQLAELRQQLLHYMTDNSRPSGGVYHSTPIALISKAPAMKDQSTDSTTKQPNLIAPIAESNTRYKKHILYGGMDNALHLIDDDTGEEVVAYFGQAILAHNGQYKAITDKTMAQSVEAIPSFGMDGPWTQYVRHQTKANGDKVANPLYVFGGARLGAKAYYGLDLTGLDKVHSAANLNGFRPKQLFSITPDRQDFGNFYFRRLGYSWSKPVITHINWFGKSTLVAILSGGYDANEYDKPDGVRQRHYRNNDYHPSLGNAVYIVDAKTGVPLIVATGTASSTASGGTLNSPDPDSLNTLEDSGFKSVAKGSSKVLQVTDSSLAYSIVGSVKAMDRDNDSLTDHLYFADLEGQLFRLDLDNVASSSTVANKVRVVRLADFRADNTLPGPRFYETPVVTIQEHSFEDGSLAKFATVTLASGDRSHPLRITDPSKQIVAIEVDYIDSSGNGQKIKALRNSLDLANHKSLDIDAIDWQFSTSDSSVDIDQSKGDINFADGVFELARHLVRPGSMITASTTFSSTEQIIATTLLPSLPASNDNPNTLPTATDPLAAKINISQHWITIKPIATAEISAFDKAANYIYTVYDKDVATANLYTTPLSKLKTRDITVTANGFPDITKIEVADTNLSGYQQQGWRAPLTEFGQEALQQSGAVETASGSTSSLKAFGPMVAISNKVYVTVYNPTANARPLASCRAQLIGSTEVHQFCLPYGNCNRADKTYHTHIQRLAYGNGMTPLSWKTDKTGQHRQLLKTSNPISITGTYSEASLLLPLNEITKAPAFSNAFTVEPQLKLEQWFDYSNHLSTVK